jgi:hypothetical protein
MSESKTPESAGPLVVKDGQHFMQYDAIVLERLKGRMPKFALHYFWQGKKICTHGGTLAQRGTIRLEGIVGHLGIATPLAS